MSAPWPRLIEGLTSFPSGLRVVLLERNGMPQVPLAASEEARLASFRGTPRESEWLWGRLAAKRAVAALADCEVADVEVTSLDSGAPRVFVRGQPGPWVSLSHTAAGAAAAAAPFPVGIDLCEWASGPRIRRIGARLLSEAEAAYPERWLVDDANACAFWAAKEAALKVDGFGIFDPGMAAITLEGLSPPRLQQPRDTSLQLFTAPFGIAALAWRVSPPPAAAHLKA